MTHFKTVSNFSKLAFVLIMKLGMVHYVPKLYKVYINDDLESTMTHFKTVSNFSKLAFVLIVGPAIR